MLIRPDISCANDSISGPPRRKSWGCDRAPGRALDRRRAWEKAARGNPMQSSTARQRSGSDSASSWSLPAARFAPACGLCSEPCSEPSRRDKSDESDPQKRGGRVCHKPCHKPLFLFADRAAKKGGSLSSFPAPLLLARDGLVVAGKPLRGKEIDKMGAATKNCRFLPQSPPYISGKKDRYGHRLWQAQKTVYLGNVHWSSIAAVH